ALFPSTTLFRSEMFDLDGPFQRHLESNAKPLDEGDALSLMLILALTLPADLAVFNAIRILSIPLTLGSMGTRAANVLNAQSFARVSYREGIQATYHALPVPERKASAQKLSLWEQSFIYGEHLNLTKPGVPPVSIPPLS